MAKTLYVRLGTNPADPVGWILYEKDGAPETGRPATIADLADQLGTSDDISVTAILPGELVARRDFPNAPKADNKMMLAGRLLLEDVLAEPIEDCHIASLRVENRARIYAVNAERLSQFLEPFDEAGLFVGAMTVDYDAIGSDHQGLTLFVEKDRVIGASDEMAFAAEGDLAFKAAELALAGSQEATIRVFGHYPQTADPDPLLYDSAGEADDATLIGLADAALADGKAVNLLQGKFRRRRAINVNWSRWRTPAALAAGLVGLLFAGTIADGMRADRLAERYRAEAVRVHTAAFPTISGDIRANAVSVLSTGTTARAFISAIPAITAAIEENETVSVDRIRFDATRRLFVISVRSPSDLAFEDIRNNLSGRGLSVSDQGGYRRSGDFWVGELNVEMS